jgi:hypothetical protein
MKSGFITIGVSTILALSSCAYASAFNVKNITSMNGIYILFNAGGGSLPKETCKPTPGNANCCVLVNKAGKKINSASFSIGSGQFSIAAGQCGSSGYAQAEFNIGSAQGDVVDASLVSGTKPTVTISPSGHETIQTGNPTSCAVQTAASQSNCLIPPAGYNPPATSQCVKDKNYCTNFYKTGQSYNVTFQ